MGKGLFGHLKIHNPFKKHGILHISKHSAHKIGTFVKHAGHTVAKGVKMASHELDKFNPLQVLSKNPLMTMLLVGGVVVGGIIVLQVIRK